MSRFSSMLDRTAEDIKAPPTLPAGIYQVRVKKPHEVTEIDSPRTGKKFEKVSFALAVVEPHEVEEDLLEEYGRNPQGVTMGLDFLFDEEDEGAAEATLNRMKIFLQDHLQCWGTKDNLQSALENAVGAECGAEVQHRPDTRPDIDRVYAEVRRTMAL